ncbi:MAG: dihydrodipicolinate synthase family protein [Chloroflexi bacterium]|nr:dihydrodipicolinate synthase family protein [Chloroflexota bacterium]GIW10868.1 MAG: dihydrodipicolinate synthase family protein [Dehalococcoidia bacterium]
MIVALVTPLHPDGTLNLAAFQQLCQFVIASGCQAVLVGGTTGEGPLLSREERTQLVAAAVAAIGSERVVAHIGDLTTAGAVALAMAAERAGASALTALTPWFYAQDEVSLLTHYTAVAAATSLPLYLYNLPARSGNVLPPGVVSQLRERSARIVGIKDSGGDLLLFQEYLAAGGADFAGLWGPDGLALGALAHGAAGLVSGNANFVPELIVGLYRAFQAGDWVTARQLQAQVQQVRAALRDGAHLGLFKWAVSWRGIPAGAPRPPLRAPSTEEAAQAERTLRLLGFSANSALTTPSSGGLFSR